MRTTILLISLFLISFFTINAQTANNLQPINLGGLLLDEPSIEKMVVTCQYYNLTEIEGEEDFISFRHPTGWIIKFKINEIEGETNPLIELIFNEKIKTVRKELFELGYRKLSDKEYEKGSRLTNRYSKCTIYSENPVKIIFTKVEVKDSERFETP